MSTSSTKRRIGRFHIVVVQWTSVDLQSCCFAHKTNFFFFALSLSLSLSLSSSSSFLKVPVGFSPRRLPSALRECALPTWQLILAFPGIFFPQRPIVVQTMTVIRSVTKGKATFKLATVSLGINLTVTEKLVKVSPPWEALVKQTGSPSWVKLAFVLSHLHAFKSKTIF